MDKRTGGLFLLARDVMKPTEPCQRAGSINFNSGFRTLVGDHLRGVRV